MKKSFFMLSLATFALAFQLSAQGMQFHEGTWAEVLAEAKAKNKPIFVDAYATWCGPCKRMSADVFPDSKVGEFMNKNYISYKLDVEKGEGVAFSEKYGVSLLPTLFYFDAQGELIHKVVGGATAENFIDASQKALLPENQVYAQKAKFDGGNRDKAFLLNYINMTLDASESALLKPAFTAYWTLLTDAERQTEATFNLLTSAVNDQQSPEFEYFLKNKAAYQTAVGAERTAGYLDQVLQQAAAKATSAELIQNPKKDLPKVAKTLYPIMPDKKGYIDNIVAYTYYAQIESNTKEAQDVYHEHYMKYSIYWQQLNAAAWYMVEQRETKQYKRALQWINRSISLDKNFFNLDTKAWLLHLSGKNKEALTTAEEAVKLAIEQGQDPAETQALIETIKNSKKTK
jgi:thioredoxin-related protein